MGAVTVAIKARFPIGPCRAVLADVTFSSSYGAGGDTFTPSQFFMTTVNAIIPLYASPSILVYKSAVKGMAASNNPTQEGPTWNIERWHW